MANQTRIIRSVDSTPNNFTPLSNKLIQDSNLSLDTIGLMCYLLSLPNDWIIYKEQIQKHFGYGRKRMDRMWSEAKKGGYLKSEKYRLPNGTWNYQYTLTDVPLSTVPLSTVGSSNVGKGYTIQNKHKQKTQEQNTQNNTIPIKGYGVNSSNSNNSNTVIADDDIIFLNEEKMLKESSLWDDSQPNPSTLEDLKSLIQNKFNNL